jgi:hypothetical protein
VAEQPKAEVARDWDRPLDPERDADVAELAPPDPGEFATEDLIIDRPDLGPGAGTLVARGDRIPEHLAALPRRPVAEHAGDPPAPKRKG